jgi:malonyl CoA-acyl carrier protein transacylase
MPKTIPCLKLLAAQTRMINASEGFHLEVQSGCLWLTRPGDAVDRFLVAGSSIELHENQVLIQSDRHLGATGLEAARYLLTPICLPRSKSQGAITKQPTSRLGHSAGVIDAVFSAFGIRPSLSKR